MAEFKIARLRYNWAGQWADSTFYNRDAVVQYNGKTYVCLVAHTSAEDFYDDFYYVTETLANEPRWTLMIDGVAWKQSWQPNTLYSLGNIVQYGGVVYICTIAHTSGSQEITAANWTTYASFNNWNTDWSINTAYGIGDLVKYGGIVYRCTTNHVSASTIALGLEDDLSSWAIVNNGIEYKFDWTATTRYKLNDIVKLGADVYICTLGHTSASSFDDTKFDLWMPGTQFVTTWSSATVYQPGDVVIYGGYSYICTVINTTTNPPSTTSSNWDLLTQGYQLSGDWDTSTNYKVGDVVRQGGNLFVAASDNQNQNPTGFSAGKTYVASGSSGTTIKVDSITGIVPGMILVGPEFKQGQTVVSTQSTDTIIINVPPNGILVDAQSLNFVGVNYVFWTLVIPGVEWIGFWTSTTSYLIGDLVIWSNGTYRCITNHTSSSLSRPDNDVDYGYWVPYALHARENAGNTIGDIVTRANSINISVPILPEGASIGDTQDYVLQVNNGLPSWSEINLVPDVYYVAPGGQDIVTYGNTWDHPWASIKYACEQIISGTYNANAAYLLLINKEFIVEDMYQWMLYQVQEENSPFTALSTFDEFSTKRDARIVIDALIYDVGHNCNSKTVFATLAYFALGSTSTFRNTETDAAQPYIVAALNRLAYLVGIVVNNDLPDFDYQIVNDVPTPVLQVIDPLRMGELGADVYLDNLLTFLITAIENADTSEVPTPNKNITSTIMVKTGTYEETLPIVVPEYTAINGDELRGAVVRPKVTVYTTAVSSESLTDTFTLLSVENIDIDMPIQFSVASVNDEFSGINLGQTYYVKTINSGTKRISVSSAIGGATTQLTTGTGQLVVYAGDCLKDMFYVRNAAGIRNLTLTGLAGSLTDVNQFGTQRPTGGAYVSLDPGTSADDTSAWILSRSPYIQNVTNFGTGCVGLKIDGTLHNGGNKSIVCNDFTQILSDGIGVWCTGPGALTECVSVFSYYNYAGYFAEDGGRIRATNGNSSYGTYGVIAEGFDPTEVPISAKVNNRSLQVQASVQSAFGSNAQLVSMQYNNAGSNYKDATTNMLTYSNQFLTGWSNDGNVTIQQNITSPVGNTDGWTITGNTSNTLECYVYKNTTISPPGASFTGLTLLNVTGSGINGTVDIVVTATEYLATVNLGGSNYVQNGQLRVPGSQLGGVDGANDCILTITSVGGVGGTQILGLDPSGLVPTNSDLNYTLSVYVKQGSSPTVDLEIEFSGGTTNSATATFEFTSEEFTVINESGGATIDSYDVLPLPDGWYRIWIVVYDTNADNTDLEYRIYPRGKTGVAGYTRIYGAQQQIGSSPTFYLETTNNIPTAYTNFTISGSGSGASVVGDEIRSSAVFQVRLTDEGLGTGGRGYLIASNNAQGGNDTNLIISGSDTNLAENYVGMRAFIQSGTGAGQYGYISGYDDVGKIAQVLKESFTTLSVASANATTDRLTLSPGFTTDTLYDNQAIQFIPTYYTTTATRTSKDSLAIVSIVGGQTNTIEVPSTVRLLVNMPVRFEGTVIGGLASNFTYYITEIVNTTKIKVSTTLGGGTWALQTATPVASMTILFPGYTNTIIGSTTNMIPHMPIIFTGTAIGGIAVGTTYYVNDVLDSNAFTISSTLITFDITDTDTVTDYLTTDSTASLVPLNPIIFSGDIIGGLTSGTKYYISNIIDINNFTITDTVITTTATATATGSNLITVLSTEGFITNNPIQFIGNTFGGLVSSNIYYVLAINDDTTFTISASPGGVAVELAAAVGSVSVRTTDGNKNVTSESGIMVATTTNTKTTLAFGYGSMTATYSTTLFGGIESGVTYYIESVVNISNFKISDSLGGPVFGLTQGSGSMSVGAVGWDHINPGTPIEANLDTSSVYYIEPRVSFEEPDFNQTATTTNTLALTSAWTSIAYGDGIFMAVADKFATAGKSDDGTTWTAVSLPEAKSWTSVAYGNGYWVIISQGGAVGDTQSTALVSKAAGDGWTTTLLPSKTVWKKVVYGNGIFVAVDSNPGPCAYSTDYGVTWQSGGDPSVDGITSIAYGAGKFVVVGNVAGTGYGAVSTDGLSWSASNPTGNAAWADIAYGNGLFVTVSETSAEPSYSLDGITWYAGPYEITATAISYGQGIFLSLDANGGDAHTSEDGINWTSHNVTNDQYGAVTFGFTEPNWDGQFVTVSQRTVGSVINAGARAKCRATVSSGRITGLTIWEPGSNYATAPTITFRDPNTSLPVTTAVRTSNGTLANPTFLNRGTGYNTSSTVVKINGSGYADTFQTGLTLIVRNLQQLPGPGDNLTISGNDTIYKVTSATAAFGTTAPNIEANIQISPDMSVELSPDHDADVLIRTKYSQARLTGHDFLNIGYGNAIQSNYPNVPEDTVLASQDQAVEINFGRVFYTSTDQDGNFRVGNLFSVEQATGIITLSASQFGLTGLETLSLGGVAVGSASVVIRQFSTDENFVANSNEILPTQRAIKGYLTNRLSQGGSNTFTGQLIAGTVLIGGPDKISSTIPNGTEGSRVEMPRTVHVRGEFAGWDGDGMAMSFFMKTWNRR
jgi:hypothetical protein